MTVVSMMSMMLLPMRSLATTQQPTQSPQQPPAAATAMMRPRTQQPSHAPGRRQAASMVRLVVPVPMPVV